MSETELKTAVHELENILDTVQPIEVDQTPEFSTLEANPESGIPPEYNIFDSRMPGLLNEEAAPASPDDQPRRYNAGHSGRRRVLPSTR